MKIVIIGAGAAGYFAAIVAAESNPQADVLLLEKGHDVLTKVRISGGGRCNVTHACEDPKKLTSFYPRGEQELRGPFTRFQSTDTVKWFADHGVELKTEADGRMFPVSNQSTTIIDCFKTAAEKAGVRVQTQISIRSIQPQPGGGFVLTKEDGASLKADKLLITTGSNREGYRWAEALGHTIVAPVPSLFTFQISDIRLHGLSGLSVKDAAVELEGTKIRQTGPVLITHWGLSGPAILRLSAWGARALHEKNYQAPLRVNWLPQFSKTDLLAYLQQLKVERGWLVVAGKSPFPEFAQRLWSRFTQTANLPSNRKWSELSNEEVMRLIDVLQNSRFNIQGKGIFKEEFVTCGGVKLSEINFKTMESKRVPGLHFAGEILDIDGITGGFNFQNAWTTGYLAGRALVDSTNSQQ